MRVVEPQPSQPGDSLDGLLRKFFRSQLPHPWPVPRALCAVSAHKRPSPIGQSLVRGRWVLAASVALLLFGSLLLPNRFTTDAKSENGLSGPMISDNPRGTHKQQNKRKEVEKRNEPGLGADEEDHLPNLDESEISSLK
jgi:hypothetical protein